MITWLFGFFVGVGIGAIVTFGVACWYLKDLFPIEPTPIEKPTAPIKDKVWLIFLDDPRTIGFTVNLISKYAEITEELAGEILKDLFHKNMLTRQNSLEIGWIYYRNPAALFEFSCKKCGHRNKPKYLNSFVSGYTKTRHSDKPLL